MRIGGGLTPASLTAFADLISDIRGLHFVASCDIPIHTSVDGIHRF